MTQDQQDVLALLGYFYLQNGKAEKAAVVYEALAALDPGDVQAALGLACAQVRLQKPESALARLDRLLERGHIGAAVHLLRGQALAQLGREAESARALAAYVAARASESGTAP